MNSPPTGLAAACYGPAATDKVTFEGFFITANYAFGQLLRDQTEAVVKAAGGTVVGDVDYPFPQTTDFSSFLVQAQSSGAQVLGFANAGKDTVNSIKQAHQFWRGLQYLWWNERDQNWHLPQWLTWLPRLDHAAASSSPVAPAYGAAC